MDTDLGRAFDTLPAMVWTSLPDGHIDFVNRCWSEYIRFSLNEAHASEWQSAVSPDDLSTVRERWQSILATCESGEMDARVRRFDGQYRRFAIQCCPIRDQTGRLVKWCGVGTDVEHLRQAEEALRRRELDFQLIFDGIPGGVEVPRSSEEAVDQDRAGRR